eukprot:TRINITY_DN68426_c0_g1_i1.p1 TRINITY_DN68426_c0_g1~~TRINITY_DN68426_c0_g1_i1.p1  ORF type:complete len:242 (-),score=31.67 TRINITY_DN68426_c0_g1_i1:15-740(-)
MSRASMLVSLVISFMLGVHGIETRNVGRERGLFANVSAPWQAFRANSSSASRSAKTATAGQELPVGFGPYARPSVWGPPTWFTLHSITLGLPYKIPLQQQESLKELMHALTFLLPCPHCRAELQDWMHENPIEPHLATRDSMVKWMISLHNQGNRYQGKKELSYEEVIGAYAEAYRVGNPQRYLTVIGDSQRCPSSAEPVQQGKDDGSHSVFPRFYDMLAACCLACPVCMVLAACAYVKDE